MQESFETQPFRDNLVQELKGASKEERKGILASVKESPEYWEARNANIAERQGEEIIDGGLGVLLEKKTLYHGSNVGNIEALDKAEYETVGEGVYFTSTAKEAVGYAKWRSKNRKGDPTIYEASVENVKLADLRKNENVKSVLAGLLPKLSQELSETTELSQWRRRTVLERAITAIQEGTIDAGSIQDIARPLRDLFTGHIKSLGYDGLITFEGGEGEIGSHDTYLIFDPKKVKLNQEQKITEKRSEAA